MEPPKVIGVIPARYESTRLPGKALLDVAGKPLIQRVYEAASRSPLLDDLLVATDSERIAVFCETSGIPCMVTSQHRSGTDRVHEVLTRTEAEIYINIQGDEPTILPSHLELLILPLIREQARVSTLRVRITEEEALNPNAVKVVCDREGRSLYFSRNRIPFPRTPQASEIAFFKHIGIYGYRRAALALFYSLPQSPLERIEKLEQLRFLENGIPIWVAETEHDTIGVDTPEDLARVTKYFAS